MANFMNQFKEGIPSATLITELNPVHSGKKSLFGLESWCCAFSPDEAYFAWSAGNCIVTIIPWYFCKSTLFKYKEITVPFKPGVGLLVDSEHEIEDCFGCNTISVHTGHLVRSLAFGFSSLGYEAHTSSRPFWSRLTSSKDLVLATGHVNGRIRTWDVFTGKLILELMDHEDLVTHLAFSPSGNLVLVSTSYDCTLKVWHFQEDGNMFQTLRMNRKPVYACCWSPDGKSLASVGMCKLIFLWDMCTLCVRTKLEGHHHDVTSCAFSPDGCLIASASWDTRVILWDVYSGQMLKFFGHLQPLPHLIFACGDNGTWIRDVSFSSDGAHIATVADDGYLRFWDITSEENPKAIAVIENGLYCNFAPSGCILAVGGKQGTVTFWSAPLCIKPLLFLARTVVRKLVSTPNIPQLDIPRHLVDYLLYKEWD